MQCIGAHRATCYFPLLFNPLSNITEYYVQSNNINVANQILHKLQISAFYTLQELHCKTGGIHSHSHWKWQPGLILWKDLPLTLSWQERVFKVVIMMIVIFPHYLIKARTRQAWIQRALLFLKKMNPFFSGINSVLGHSGACQHVKAGQLELFL